MKHNWRQTVQVTLCNLRFVKQFLVHTSGTQQHNRKQLFDAVLAFFQIWFSKAHKLQKTIASCQTTEKTTFFNEGYPNHGIENKNQCACKSAAESFQKFSQKFTKSEHDASQTISRKQLAQIFKFSKIRLTLVL